MFQCRFRFQEKHDRAAQGLVEFAIMLPLMLFILFGFIEIGRIMQSWLLIENGVRQGASYAASMEYNIEYCSGLVCDSTEIQNARIRSINDVIWSASSGIIRIPETEATSDDENFFRVIVCLQKDLIHPKSPHENYECLSEGTEEWEGENLSLLIEYNHGFLVPFFFIEETFLRMTAQRDVYIKEYTKDPLPE
jgi:hypothetical protein